MQEGVKAESSSVSKVIYFSNLPREYEIAEATLRDELIDFGRRFGEVEKVLLLMTKSSGLLQFTDVEDALQCVKHVKDHDCYLCGRTLRADFSTKKEIVSQRSSKPIELPSYERRDRSSFPPHHPPHREEYWTGTQDAPPGAQVAGRDLFDLPPNSRIVNMAVRIDADGTMTPLPSPALQASLGGNNVNIDSYRRRNTRNRSRSPPPSRPHFSNDFPQQHQKTTDPALLTCFNLPANFTVDDIATFFGVYGDVIRVKKSTRNDRQCWVQFRTPEGAQNILRFLNNITVFGRELSIEYSNVERLRHGQDPEKDRCFDTTHHRYQTRDAEFFRKHLCSPTNVLFTSNIPASTSEDELTSMLGAKRVEFLRGSNKPSMKSGFVHFENVDAAAQALIEHHGKAMSGNTNKQALMSLSFSQRRRAAG